jgi:hypothetical protein
MNRETLVILHYKLAGCIFSRIDSLLSGHSIARNIQAQNNGRTLFSVVRAATVATQWRFKHASTIIKELCFLRGPYRKIINGKLYSLVQL